MSEEAQFNTLFLDRFCYSTEGTFGYLELPDGTQLLTMERPWLDNEPFVSCIPEGIYDLSKRFSPAVNKSSRGRYVEGWEVTDVPDRSYIMVHPASFVANLEGCISVGLGADMMRHPDGDKRPGLTQSLAAFCVFMKALRGNEEWQLIIRNGGDKSYPALRNLPLIQQKPWGAA